mmetsp:Transcript_10002/g.22366  ORF Transcript_10002/g.22366 Transcript_10002/m.22366 type:complete len:622 (+) Transcript_10002:79-1944(+)
MVSPSLDKTLDGLKAKAAAWAVASPSERISVAEEMLECCRNGEWSTADRWVAQECALLGLDPMLNADGQSAAAASRFVFGSTVVDWLSTFIKATQSVELGPGSEREKVLAAAGLSRRKQDGPGGEAVFGPVALGATLPGHSFELWGRSDADHSPSSVSATKQRWKADAETGCRNNGNRTDVGVCLVLGAGNQSFLTIMDAMDRCLQHKETVLVKLHPLRPWLLKPYEMLMQPLILRGVCSVVVDGAVPDPAALVSDARVQHVHLTGAEATAQKVRDVLDASGKVAVGISAELGCATPWFVVPGTFTEAELTNAAALVACSKKKNGGCNCLAGQIVVLPRGWSQKGAFMAALEAALAQQPTEPAYYPGSRERCDKVAASAGEPIQRVVGCRMQPSGVGTAAVHDPRDDVALVHCGCVGAPDYNESQSQAVLAQEAFGPLLALVELPFEDGTDEVAKYLERAAAFANGPGLCGSLSCAVLASSSMLKAAESAAFIEVFLAALRYGTIGLNALTEFGYTAMCKGGLWCAHPDEVGARSGAGAIGNHYGLPVVKSVVRGPLLTTKPAIITLPPAIVFDALHASVTAPSVIRGALNLTILLLFRAAQACLRLALFRPTLQLYGSAV